jgi:hypothetical protein
MSPRFEPSARKRPTVLPPVTTTVVMLFHSVVNRPIRRIEFAAIDDLRQGRATSDEANFFWRTATVAWYTLMPVGLILSLLLGRTIPAIVPSTALALPLIGGSYSLAMRHATPEAEYRFIPGPWYALHDLAITGLSVLAGWLVARNL